MRDIILIDKDSTLGEFDSGGERMYPNVKAFLAGEREKERVLYVATTADARGKEHLMEVLDLFEGYYGIEELDAANGFYVTEDGHVHKYRDDYVVRIELQPEAVQKELRKGMRERGKRISDLRGEAEQTEELRSLEQEQRAFFDMWLVDVHRKTQESFDETRFYINPYLKGCTHSKDLVLARRHIAGPDYQSLRSVFVGDSVDVADSDPFTPLIRISNSVRQGNWGIVSTVIDHLFADGQTPPKAFDRMYEEGTAANPDLWNVTTENLGEVRKIKVGDHTYILGSPDAEYLTGRQRVIQCP